ncbi:hypothetical protein LXL04_007749 [Taraxacum kok-saghyz]
MYENVKEVIIYVTENNIRSNNLDFSTQLCDDRGEPHDEDDSNYLPSEETYYNEFREELQNRNQGSVVELACSQGFLVGCRSYIALDSCHLKGKFNGVLVAATGIDSNNSIFPIAYVLLKSENTPSWTWFLKLLREAIGFSIDSKQFYLSSSLCCA